MDCKPIKEGVLGIKDTAIGALLGKSLWMASNIDDMLMWSTVIHKYSLGDEGLRMKGKRCTLWFLETS